MMPRKLKGESRRLRRRFNTAGWWVPHLVELLTKGPATPKRRAEAIRMCVYILGDLTRRE